MMPASNMAPYQEIFADLLRSIMGAQADALIERRTDRPNSLIPDAVINRHFAWLTWEYREGLNRHLFEAIVGNAPLRKEALRRRASLRPEIRERLTLRRPLDASDRDVVQERPTRISQLIKNALVEAADVDADRDSLENRYNHVYLKSPLAIALDILTAPEMPGSRAYPAITLRNYLFEVFGVVPEGLAGVSSLSEFSIQEIEEALSHVWTSLRPRYWSSGEDKLPAEGRSPAGGMLRHFLAARGMLFLRFATLADCLTYLQSGEVRPSAPLFDFAKSPLLEKLPDLGELVNELWGLPVPLRGGDTLFRGGLKLPMTGGLVTGIHGGPGSGKTSLALALGAFVAPFGIPTLLLTGEEAAGDLRSKANGLLPDELRRLSFFPADLDQWLSIQSLDLHSVSDIAQELERMFLHLSSILQDESAVDNRAVPKPCRAVIVLDGLHDLLLSAPSGDGVELSHRLRQFIATCRKLRALVILTTGEDWAGDKTLDYLVDVSIRLSHEAVGDGGRKPERLITITKARHQLCAVGTHSLQISGAKGVRFSPQINYQLDRKAIWKSRLPDFSANKHVLRRALSRRQFEHLEETRSTRRSRPTEAADDNLRTLSRLKFEDVQDMVFLPRGSNIFINGEGSGGKAALAMKIATAPTFDRAGGIENAAEKVLVVSFLYPAEYYERIEFQLWRRQRIEYDISGSRTSPNTVNVIHLYPGHYRPDKLFNRIEWELDAADLHGRPYTAIIIDGIHNIFLQFPDIQDYGLFWPQLFSALRSRPIMIISTHTTFVLQGAIGGSEYRLDDRRSEPLRHALVQKVDFRLELDPEQPDGASLFPPVESRSGMFNLKIESAINQRLPRRPLYWSREHLIFFS